jgi:hypothetical protein
VSAPADAGRRDAFDRGRGGQAAAGRDRGKRFDLLQSVHHSVQFGHESKANIVLNADVDIE